MSRYPHVSRFWEEPNTVTVLWTGDGIFYANKKPQKRDAIDDIHGAPPVPTWDEWLAMLGKPAGYAYKPSQVMRYTFWITKNPYRFALLAQAHAPEQHNDHEIKSNAEFDAWTLSLGLHPDDLTSTPSGAADSVIHAVFYPLVKFIEWTPLGKLAKKTSTNPVLDHGFKVWGGELG